MPEIWASKACLEVQDFAAASYSILRHCQLRKSKPICRSGIEPAFKGVSVPLHQAPSITQELFEEVLPIRPCRQDTEPGPKSYVNPPRTAAITFAHHTTSKATQKSCTAKSWRRRASGMVRLLWRPFGAECLSLLPDALLL